MLAVFINAIYSCMYIYLCVYFALISKMLRAVAISAENFTNQLTLKAKLCLFHCKNLFECFPSFVSVCIQTKIAYNNNKNGKCVTLKCRL